MADSWLTAASGVAACGGGTRDPSKRWSSGRGGEADAGIIRAGRDHSCNPPDWREGCGICGKGYVHFSSACVARKHSQTASGLQINPESGAYTDKVCPAPWLQLNRLHLRDETACIIAKERGDYAEHGVTESAAVQDVRWFGRLRRGVRLQVDAHQLRTGVIASLQTHLVLHELLPCRHDSRRAVATRADPAFLVAHEHAAREAALAVLARGL